jgi:hypothetical protein
MPVAPISKEQIEATQSALRTELRLVPNEDERPAPANVSLLNALKGDELLYFRGRRFKVKHVGFIEGATLSTLEGRYSNQSVKEKARREARERGEVVPVDVNEVKEMLDVLEDTVALFHKLVVPVGWLYRLLWPWLRNPFEDATDQEIGELLGFFFACRTRSSVRFESRSAGRARRSHSISVTSLLPS